MHLNKDQIDILTKYFADLSKILFASTVVGFFVPAGIGPIHFSVFLGGSFAATIFVIFSLRLAQ